MNYESRTDYLLKGPVLIFSIIFIPSFLIATIIFSINQSLGSYLIYYYFLSPFFIIAIYLGFIGLLLRWLK